MSSVWRPAILLLAAGSALLAQEPPPKPDSARRPVVLPTVETTAPREERAIFEQRPNVGAITITGRDLTSAPRFFGEADVLRAVRLLPGVNARNDYSVGMNVRGGEADQNLVLLDGYPIYNPFHMGGVFGAFVEPMVSRVDFLTGGFPARYGGRLSSVLDVRSAAEAREEIHGRADVSMIATTLAIGRGMQGGLSSWNIAARRTYADKVADVLYKKGSLPYHFRDGQAHATRVFGPWRLAFTAYDNVDDMLVTEDTDSDDTWLLNWGNRLFGTTLSRTFSTEPRLFGRSLGDSATVEQRLSTTRFRLDMNLLGDVLTLDNHVTDHRASGSLTSFTRNHTRSVGYEVGRQRFDFKANYALLLYPSDTIVNANTNVGAYFDDLWRVNERWIVQSGLRFDVVTGATAVLQPRLSAKYFYSRNLAFTAAVGSFAQGAHSLAREDVPIRALDFWVGSDSTTPLSRAWHYIAGVERWLSPSRAFRLEAYYKHYGNLIEQNPYSEPNVRGDEFLPLRGHSYGADFMLRNFGGGSGKFAGWLAYGFAWSTRTDAEGRRFFPGHDRRHELNFVGNWMGRRYTRSLRFNVATGTPYTRVIGNFEPRKYDPMGHSYPTSEGVQFLVGPRNADRLPMATRLDLSLTRRGSGGVAVSPFLTIMNAYNAKNVFAYVWDYSATPPERVSLPQFPIFPTLGVSIVW